MSYIHLYLLVRIISGNYRLTTFQTLVNVPIPSSLSSNNNSGPELKEYIPFED